MRGVKGFLTHRENELVRLAYQHGRQDAIDEMRDAWVHLRRVAHPDGLNPAGRYLYRHINRRIGLDADDGDYGKAPLG